MEAAEQHVASKATLIAYDVSEFGEREVVGVGVADGEMEDAWRKFLGGLVERGLRGVKLVISDAHLGLRAGYPLKVQERHNYSVGLIAVPQKAS